MTFLAVTEFMESSSGVILTALTFAMGLGAIRLLRGPSLADRVVALDFIGTICAGMTAVYAIRTGEPLYLRATVVIALVLFLGTVGFAIFLEKRGAP